MKIKLDSSGFKRKLKAFPEIVNREVDKAFYKLIKNARLAMNTRIEDYPSFSNKILRKTLQEEGIEPQKGLLRASLEASMENGTKTKKYRNRFSREVIDINKLNSLTPWGGIGGERPIQSPNKWEQNPYSGYGFWRTYNDGFTWESGARIIGRNFTDLGFNYIKENFNHEIKLAIRRALYHIRKVQ
jgi:hypothetical protein